MKKYILIVLLLLTQAAIAQTVNVPDAPIAACDTEYRVIVSLTGLTAGNTITVTVTNNADVQFKRVQGYQHTITGTQAIWDTIVSSSNMTFTYYNRTKCSSLNNPSGNLSRNVTDNIQVVSGATNLSLNATYTINLTKIQAVQSTYNPTIFGDVNETISKNVRYNNLGNTFNGYIELTETVQTGVSITGVSITGATFIKTTQIGNTYKTLLFANLNQNTGFFYIPNYKITNCSYTSTGSTALTSKIGCDSNNICQTLETLTSGIGRVVKGANITVIQDTETDITPLSCDNIAKRYKYTVMYKNTGTREATDILLALTKSTASSNADIYNFGIIDPNSIKFTLKSSSDTSIAQRVINTTTTNMCGNALSASVPYFGSTPTGARGTYCKLNTMQIGDTLIIEYEMYRCCITEYKDYSYSEAPTIKFTPNNYVHNFNRTIVFYQAHPCNAPYSSSAWTTRESSNNGIKLVQENDCEVSDIQGRINEDFTAEIIGNSYTNTAFTANDPNMEIRIRVQCQKGIRPDTLFMVTTTNTVWKPSSYITTPLTPSSPDDYYHEVWAVFPVSTLPSGTNLNSFIGKGGRLMTRIISYCGAREPSSEYVITTYVKETDCSTCLMPIAKTNCIVNVHCPGCVLPGTTAVSFGLQRTTTGLIDADNNRLPDIPLTRATSGITLNRFAYGDTLQSDFIVRVDDLGDSATLNTLQTMGISLNKAYSIFRLDAGEVFSLLGAKIYFTHSGTTDSVIVTPALMASNPNLLLTRLVSDSLSSTISKQKREYSFDLSLATLQPLGMDNMAGLTRYNGGDYYRIVMEYVLNQHFGTKYFKGKFSTETYMTAQVPTDRFVLPPDYLNDTTWTVATLDGYHSFWCEQYAASFSMVDFNLTFGNFSDGAPSTLSNCTRNFRKVANIIFPIDKDDYFLNEYRNFLLADSVKAIMPVGYEVTSATVTIDNSGSGIAPYGCSFSNTQANLPVSRPNPNTGVIYPFSFYYYGNNCTVSNQLLAIEERNSYSFDFYYRPICNNTVPTLASGGTMQIYYHNMPNTSGLETETFGTINNKKFAPKLIANSINYAAETRHFRCSTPLIIQDTAKYNGSTYQSFNLNAPNVFIAIVSPSGRFICDSLINTSGGFLLPTNGIFRIGNIGAIGNNLSLATIKNYLISGKYDCTKGFTAFNDSDKVNIIYGWGCNGYPTTLSDLTASGNCFSYDSAFLYVTPRDIIMQIDLNTDKDTLKSCDVANVQLSMQSTSQGYLYNIVSSVQLYIPPTMELCDTLATVLYNGQTDTVSVQYNSGTGVYTFDLTAITENGLNDSNKVIINTCVRTKCTVQDTATIILKTQSVAYCGDTLEQSKSTLLHILPYKPSNPDTLQVTANNISITPCDSVNTTITVTNTGTNSSTRNILQVTVPTSVSISGSGWSSTGTNSWQFAVGNLAADTTVTIPIRYSTTINTLQNLNYVVSLIQTDSVSCYADTCQKDYIVTADTFQLTTNSCVPDTLTILTADTSICIGKKVLLQATTTSTDVIQWYAGTTLIVSGASLLYQPTSTGVIQIIAQLQNQTTTKDTMYITVNPDCLCPANYDIIWGQLNQVDTVWVNDTQVYADKKILILGTVVFKADSNSDTLRFTNSVIKVNGVSTGDLSQAGKIIIDSLYVDILGTDITAACDTMWGGIELLRNAGLYMTSIGADSSSISHATEALYSRENNIFNGQIVTGFKLRKFYVGYSKFINNYKGVHLVMTAYKLKTSDVIRNSSFRSDSLTMKFPLDGRVATQPLNYMRIAIELEDGYFYGMNIANNVIKNSYYGIRGTLYRFNGNTLKECYHTAIATYNLSIPNYWGTGYNYSYINNNTITMSEFVARTITIANPTLLTEQFGIYVQGNCLVLNNTISRTVSKQPFRDFHKGIYVHSAKSYTLNNNKIDNLDRGIIMQNRSMVTGTITKNTLTDNYYGVTAERNNISTTSMYVQIRCNAFNNTWAAPSGSPLTIKRGIYIEPSTYLNNLGGCSTAINTRLIPCNNTYSSSAGSWLTIHNDNITSIDYYRASSENIIPFIGLTNIVCTISNSCSTSNINPTALEHISTGNTLTAQEANQYQQQISNGNLTAVQEKPLLYDLAGYYEKTNNTQGLETFRQSLATGSHSRNVLTEYLYYNAIDEADYTKAQAHKTELVQQNPNNTEIQDWGKHTTALEAINHISTPTNYTLAATERVLLEQVANNTVSLNMEACRRLNLHGIGANCTPPVNLARKAAKNTPEIDWSRLASNDSLNLVPNYSFEIYDSCTKEQGQGLIQFATGWKRFTDTPDYLNPCWDTLYPTSNPKYGVPDNIFAYSYPAHGNSYAHEIVYNNWYDSVYCDVNVAMSEKAGIMLKQSLKSGTKYYVGFMVKLARCGYATNKIGMRFTSNEWFNRCELDYGYDHLHTDSIITDSINWTPIAGSFTTEIDSVYKYVVIGNFHYITQTDTIKIPQSGTIIVNPDRSTYLIDKIVVTEDSAYFYSMINGIKTKTPTDQLTGFKLYPNPATNTVTIEAPEQGRIIFKDVLGRERLEVRTKMLDKQTVDISHLPTGVYIYEYRTEKGNTTGKLIIE